MENFYVNYHTDIGIKKKTNQDSILVKGIAKGNEETLLVTLCDGMGGMAKGELASATVIREFSNWLDMVYTKKGMAWSAKEIEGQWQSLLGECNMKLIQYGISENIQLGTTITVMLFRPNSSYVIGHVGDTRAYRLTDRLEQLTEDHTYIAREIKRGNMTPEQAAKDSRRNVLLQCIGVNNFFEPQFLEGTFSGGQGYLLCSDGFRHVVTGDEIFYSLNPNRIQQEGIIKVQLKELIDLNMQRKETDNISAVYIKIK